MRNSILLLIALLGLTSCSTQGYVSREHKKSVNRARRLLDRKIESIQHQFVIVNNQIIIFENANN